MQLRILLRMRESMGILQVPLVQSWRLGVSLIQRQVALPGGLGSCSSMPCFSAVIDEKTNEYVKYVREF